MIKKLLITFLFVIPASVFGQSVDIEVGTSNSDTTEVCNGASINVSVTTSGITSITGYSWQISNGSNVTNASGSSFTFSPTSTGLYTINATVYGSDTVSETSYADVTAPLSSVTISSLGNLNSQTLCYGSLSGTINSVVSGGGNSLSYNWEKKVGLGNWISLGTNSPQLIDSGALTQNSEYRLSVINSAQGCGNLTSNVLSFSVYTELVAPVISSSQILCYGESPSTLTRTTASGGDGAYSYEWQKSTDNSTWVVIANNSSSSLNPGSLTEDTYYRSVVSDACNSAVSNTILMDVYDQINAGNLTAADNQICWQDSTDIILNNTSGGDGVYSFGWEVSNDGVNFATLSNQTSATYNTGSLIADKYYRVTVNSGCGNSEQTSIVHVSVAPGYSITPLIYSGSTTICYDNNPSTISVTPSGGRAPYTYAWQKRTTGANTWSTIPNANQGFFNENSGLKTGTDYRAVVTSSDGCGTLLSNVQTINVRDELTAPTVSSPQTICYNTDATVSRSGASGADGNYTYQWQSSSDNITYANVGSGSSAVNTGNLTQSTYFRVKVSNSLCSSEKTSGSSLITVRDPIDAGTISVADSQVCQSSFTTLNANNVTGADGNYTYQWQYLNNNVGNWTNTGSANSPSLITAVLTENTSYRVRVNSGCNVEDISSSVLIDVADNFSVGTIQNTGSDTICYGASPSILTISGNGGRAPYSYQWQRKGFSSTFWTNVGSNSSSFSEVSNLTESAQYRVVLTSSDGCGTVVSPSYDIIVRPDIVPPTLSNDVLICHNTSTTLTRSAATGANSQFNYQWEKSSDNSNFVSDGSSSINNSTGALTSTTWYRVKVSNVLCSATKYSASVRVKVRDELLAGLVSASDNQICFNSGTSLSLSNTSGGDTSYSYSWEYNEGNTGWTSVGSNSTSVITPNHKSDVEYRVVVGSGCGENDTTSNLLVDVADSLIIGSIVNLGSDTICYNTLPSTLTVNGSGGRTPYYYQWQRKLVTGSVWSNVGPNTSTYNESFALLASVQYRVKIISQDGCGTVTSSPYTIIVRPDLTAPSISPNTVICNNTSTTLSRGTASGADGSFVYQWQKSSDGINFNPLSQTGQSYNTGNLTSTTWFRVLATNNLCSTSILSNPVRVKVRDSLFSGTISVLDDEICFNTSADLSIVGTTGADSSFTYDWQFNENGSGWNSFSTASVNISSPQHEEDVQYRAIVNSGCNLPDTSNTLTVTVSDSLNAGVISVFEDSVCFGSSPMQMSLIGNTGGYTPYSFNWERRKGLNGSWFTVSTAGPTYQELDSTKIDTYYRITITSDQGCGTVTTPVQKFRVNALPGDDSWSILGPDEVCSGASGINYQLSSDYNNGTVLWSINNASLSSNSLTKLFADFDDLGQLTNDTLEVVLTSNRTGCERTIIKPLTLLEQSSPELAQIVQKAGTNILICSDTTQGVKYHWGYIPKSSGLVQLVPGATGRYHNFNTSLDTSNNVYFVRTSYGTCHTFSYFGVSSNPLGIEENGFDIILYPNPTSEYINIESNISPQRVWLSEASGRMIPLEPRNNRVMVPDQLSSGFYVLTLEIDGSLVQKKVIIDRR